MRANQIFSIFVLVLVLFACLFAVFLHGHSCVLYSSDSHGDRDDIRPWSRVSNIFRPLIRPDAKPAGLPDGWKCASKDLASSQYHQDVVLRFKLGSAKNAKAFSRVSDILYLDVWEFNRDWVDIRVADSDVPLLLDLLPLTFRTSYVPLMQGLNLTQAVIESYPSTPVDLQSYSSPINSGDYSFFREYRPYSVILSWMHQMQATFPSNTSLIEIGKSYEGRSILGLRVGANLHVEKKRSKKRKTILIIGGVHAREWITTSTVNFLAFHLISFFGENLSITNMVESFDWVLIPTINPDGYVYSWEADRFWKNNRQPTRIPSCHGIDLDRSYPFKWDVTRKRSPCSPDYAGESPLDGIETKHLIDWVRSEHENNNMKIAGFIDLHSYSQEIYYPYFYSCYDIPPTIENMEELSYGLVKAMWLSRNGARYAACSACEGNAAHVADVNESAGEEKGDSVDAQDWYFLTKGGSALDWFNHDMKVDYSYQIRLRDLGGYGYLLPKNNIIPTGNEVLNAMIFFANFLLREEPLLEEVRHPIPHFTSPMMGDEEDAEGGELRR